MYSPAARSRFTSRRREVFQKCRRCGHTKWAEEFRRRSRTDQRLRATCAVCEAIRRRVRVLKRRAAA